MSHYAKGLKALAAVALGAAMIVSAAACGTNNGDASDSASSKAAKGFDVSSIKKDDAIAAIAPASVTKDGTLTVGSDISYAPAEFLDADGKTVIGYDVDLSKAIAAVLGLKEKTIPSSFDSIIPSVGSKYDIGMSAFTVTKERLKSVDFVSYFNAGSTYVVKKGNPKKINTADLCGSKFAVGTGTIQEAAVGELSKQCAAAGKKPMQTQSFKAQSDATTAVATGKADIFYADSPVAGYAVKLTNGTLQTIGKAVDVAPEGIIIKKGDDATAQAVQKALQKLIDDGTYAKILNQWGVTSGAIDKAEINPAV
jgi:polar amino acid transport system substrate-binding protein